MPYRHKLIAAAGVAAVVWWVWLRKRNRAVRQFSTVENAPVPYGVI